MEIAVQIVSAFFIGVLCCAAPAGLFTYLLLGAGRLVGALPGLYVAAVVAIVAGLFPLIRVLTSYAWLMIQGRAALLHADGYLGLYVVGGACLIAAGTAAAFFFSWEDQRLRASQARAR